MSNLKQRVQQIQQQLALNTAETIASFKEVRASMDQGFAKLENALTEQGEKNHKAIDDLLALIADQDQQTQQALADHEARLQKLEGAA